jgi:hypothetical protein
MKVYLLLRLMTKSPPVGEDFVRFVDLLYEAFQFEVGSYFNISGGSDKGLLFVPDESLKCHLS